MHLIVLSLVVAFVSTALGCSGGVKKPGPVSATAVSGLATGDRESAGLSAAAENTVLESLAAVDSRLAARMRVVPSEAALSQAAMGALVHGDEGAFIVRGGTDFFSFDVRERRLKEVEVQLAHPPPRPTLEWDLLVRLVAEEKARLEAERALPTSASELVRGIVSTWKVAATTDEVKERDRWLTHRLDEIRASLAAAPLRPIEVTELEEALDPLERLADPLGFPDLVASLTKLRIALGQLRQTAPVHAKGWNALQRDLIVYLGISLEPKALRATLIELSAALREEATARLAALPDAEVRAVRSAAEGLILRAGPCDEPSGSRIRAFLPAPERAPVCAALRSLAEPTEDHDGSAARIALADDVTLAIWAVEINGDDVDPDRAARAHRLVATVPPEREARLLRLVATRPLLPLGVAMAVSLLTKQGGAAERALHAAKWLALGDVPLDIAARELGL